MIGPRAGAPRNAVPLWKREGLPGKMSSFVIAITWVAPGTGASCVAPLTAAGPSRCRRFIDHLMRQPRRDRPGDKAHQAIEDELGDTAVRSARAVEQFGCDKADHADDQHPHNPA